MNMQNNENKRVAVAGRIEPQVNRYYLKISRRYMVAGIAMMILLLLYVICVMSFFGEYVTYDNLKYLARDFEAMTLPGSSDFTPIVYTGRENMRFAYFKNGLAVSDGESYFYYDASGVSLIEETVGYADPVLVPSDKYLLAYDLGSGGYSVYNQLTRIIERESSMPIIDGDIASDGTMVIASRSRDTKYVVDVYNSAFNRTMSIYKENYVLAAEISDDGDYIIICSAIPADTGFNCEIEICQNGQSEKVFCGTYENTMPLDAYAYKEGFAVLCDKGVYFFAYDGHMINGSTFTGMSLRFADICAETAAAVGNVNALGSENRVIVYSTDGNILYDKEIRERITGVYASVNTSDALVYYTTSDSVKKVLPDGQIISVSVESGDVLDVIPDKNGALICYKNGAEHHSFND